MKKLISFIAAATVAMTSLTALASPYYTDVAEADRKISNVPAEDTVETTLDIRSSTGTSYANHDSQGNALSSSVTPFTVNARATLDMTNVAREWEAYLDAAVNSGFDKDAVVEKTVIAGEFKVEITGDAAISNANLAVENPTEGWTWDDKTQELFDQKSVTYNSATNTFTLVMGVKGTNAEFNDYFTSILNGTASSNDLTLTIPNTVVTAQSELTTTGEYHSVAGNFSGAVNISFTGLSKSYTVNFAGTDTEWYRLYKTASRGGGGGGGTRATATPTAEPTAKPFVSATSIPISETIEEDYNDDEVIAEKGALKGFTINVKTSEGDDGVLGVDYTITDADGNTLTPAEVNALLNNPSADLSSYNINLAEGATADTDAIYSSGAEIDYNNHFAYIIGYDDNTVRPMNNITRAEVATIFFRLLTDDSRVQYWTTDNSFSDVNSSDWFNNAISTVANAGIVNGYEDGTFRPDAPITRAEFAAIASRFASGNGVEAISFADISGHWAEDAINKAASVGWITGYEDGTFRPDNRITRAEAMTIINRVTYRIVDADGISSDAIQWIDNDPSAWYYANVEEATNAHTYAREALGDTEQWTEVIPQRDWETLEKETSEKADAAITGNNNGAIDILSGDNDIILEENGTATEATAAEAEAAVEEADTAAEEEAVAEEEETAAEEEEAAAEE